MSLSASLFGENSLIFKATNILGLGIPGLLHRKFGPQDPEAQRLGDISQQTAKEGDPRVIVWGRVRPIGGNVIHCQEPKKRMVKQSSSGGGKGGSKKKEQKVEHVFRTYAIGVCEGPITGFSRIWRNNKLVYDARGNAWGAKNNRVFLKTFRLYLGGWSQMPDPTLQSIWGAGNVPAYRGTAYMVSINEDLTELGGSVPQWQFEVERAEGIYYTSEPYRMGVVEGLQLSAAGDISGTIRTGQIANSAPTETLDMSVAEITGGELRDILKQYNNYAPDGIDLSGAEISGGNLRNILKTYVNYAPEGLDMSGAAVTGGSLRNILIAYTNYAPEGLDISGASITGGSLV